MRRLPHEQASNDIPIGSVTPVPTLAARGGSTNRSRGAGKGFVPWSRCWAVL